MLLKIGLGFAAIAGVLVLGWSQQRYLIYVPDATRVAPKEAGLDDVREVELATPDGNTLVLWYKPAKAGQPTLLYFHGNAGNLANRAGRFGEYTGAGRGMLMMSYRGYSGSSGTPSEKKNVADAELAYEWLLSEGVAPGEIVLYGESLGSGVAVQLAARRKVGGVILDAPYTSIADVGARLYPFLPVHSLILDPYDSVSRIAGINAPLLILHGQEDELIPISFGRDLFEKARAPKQFAAIPRAGHNDHHLYGSTEIAQQWINKTFGLAL